MALPLRSTGNPKGSRRRCSSAFIWLQHQRRNYSGLDTVGNTEQGTALFGEAPASNSAKQVTESVRLSERNAEPRRAEGGATNKSRPEEQGLEIRRPLAPRKDSPRYSTDIRHLAESGKARQTNARLTRPCAQRGPALCEPKQSTAQEETKKDTKSSDALEPPHQEEGQQCIEHGQSGAQSRFQAYSSQQQCPEEQPHGTLPRHKRRRKLKGSYALDSAPECHNRDINELTEDGSHSSATLHRRCRSMSRSSIAEREHSCETSATPAYGHSSPVAPQAQKRRPTPTLARQSLSPQKQAHLQHQFSTSPTRSSTNADRQHPPVEFCSQLLIQAARSSPNNPPTSNPSVPSVLSSHHLQVPSSLQQNGETKTSASTADLPISEAEASLPGASKNGKSKLRKKLHETLQSPGTQQYHETPKQNANTFSLRGVCSSKTVARLEHTADSGICLISSFAGERLTYQTLPPDLQEIRCYACTAFPDTYIPTNERVFTFDEVHASPPEHDKNATGPRERVLFTRTNSAEKQKHHHQADAYEERRAMPRRSSAGNHSIPMFLAHSRQQPAHQDSDLSQDERPVHDASFNSRRQVRQSFISDPRQRVLFTRTNSAEKQKHHHHADAWEERRAMPRRSSAGNHSIPMFLGQGQKEGQGALAYACGMEEAGARPLQEPVGVLDRGNKQAGMRDRQRERCGLSGRTENSKKQHLLDAGRGLADIMRRSPGGLDGLLRGSSPEPLYRKAGAQLGGVGSQGGALHHSAACSGGEGRKLSTPDPRREVALTPTNPAESIQRHTDAFVKSAERRKSIAASRVDRQESAASLTGAGQSHAGKQHEKGAVLSEYVRGSESSVNTSPKISEAARSGAEEQKALTNKVRLRCREETSLETSTKRNAQGAQLLATESSGCRLLGPQLSSSMPPASSAGAAQGAAFQKSLGIPGNLTNLPTNLLPGRGQPNPLLQRNASAVGSKHRLPHVRSPAPSLPCVQGNYHLQQQSSLCSPAESGHPKAFSVSPVTWQRLPHSCALSPKTAAGEPLGCFPLNAPGPQPVSVAQSRFWAEELQQRCSSSCMLDSQLALENSSTATAIDMEVSAACRLPRRRGSQVPRPCDEAALNECNEERGTAVFESHHGRSHSEEPQTTFCKRIASPEPLGTSVVIEPATRAICFRGHCAQGRQVHYVSRCGRRRKRLENAMQQETPEEQIRTEDLIDRAQNQLRQACDQLNQAAKAPLSGRRHGQSRSTPNHAVRDGSVSSLHHNSDTRSCPSWRSAPSTNQLDARKTSDSPMSRGAEETPRRQQLRYGDPLRLGKRNQLSPAHSYEHACQEPPASCYSSIRGALAQNRDTALKGLPDRQADHHRLCPKWLQEKNHNRELPFVAFDCETHSACEWRRNGDLQERKDHGVERSSPVAVSGRLLQRPDEEQQVQCRQGPLGCPEHERQTGKKGEKRFACGASNPSSPLQCQTQSQTASERPMRKEEQQQQRMVGDATRFYDQQVYGGLQEMAKQVGGLLHSAARQQHSPLTEPCPSWYTRTAVKRGTPCASSPMLSQGVSACEPFGKGCCTLQCSPPVSITGQQTNVSSHETGGERNMRTEATESHAKNILLEQDLCMAKCGYACTVPSQPSSNTNPGAGYQENPPVPATECSAQATGDARGACTWPSVAKGTEASPGAPVCLPAAARSASHCRRTSLSPLQSGTGTQHKTPSPICLIGQGSYEAEEESPTRRRCLLPTNQSSKPTDLSAGPGMATQTDGSVRVSPTAKLRYNYCPNRQHYELRRGKAPSVGLSSSVTRSPAAPAAPVRLAVSARGDVCASPFSCSCHMHPRQLQMTDAPGCIPLSSLKVAEAYAKLPNRDFADGAEHEEARGAASVLTQRNAPGSLTSHLSTAESRSSKQGKRFIWDPFQSHHQSIPLQQGDGAREARSSLHSHRSPSPATERAGCALSFSCAFPIPAQSGFFRSCIQAQRCTPVSAGGCEVYCCAPLQTESQEGRIDGTSRLPERNRQDYLSIQEAGLVCRPGSPGPQVKEHVNANQVADVVAVHPPATESQGLTTAQQLLLELERLPEPNLPSSPTVSSPPTLAATLTPALLTPPPAEKVSFAESALHPQAKQQNIQAGIVSGAVCHTSRAGAAVAETVQAARVVSPLPHHSEHSGLVYAPPEPLKVSVEMRGGHRLNECTSVAPRARSAQAQQSTRISTFLQSPHAPQSGALQTVPSSPRHRLKESFTFCDVSSEGRLIPIDHKQACRSPPPCSAASSLIAGQKETDQQRIPAVLWTIAEAPTVVTELTSQPASLSAQGPQLPISPPGQGGSSETNSTSVKEPCGSKVCKDVVPQRHIAGDTTRVIRHTTSPAGRHEVRCLLPDEAEAHKTSRSPSIGRTIAMRLVSRLRRAVYASRRRRRSASPSKALCTRSITELVVTDTAQQQAVAGSLAEPSQHPPPLPLSQNEAQTGLQGCALLQRAGCNLRERGNRNRAPSLQGQQQHSKARSNKPPTAHGPADLAGGTFQEEKRTAAGCNSSSYLHTAACFEPLRFSTSNSHYLPPPTDIVSLPKSLAFSPPLTKSGESPVDYMPADARSRCFQHTSPTRASVREALEGARRAVAAANSALESPGAQKIASYEKSRLQRHVSTRQLGHLPAQNPKASKQECRPTRKASSVQRSWTLVERAELNQWRQLLERNRELQRRRG